MIKILAIGNSFSQDAVYYLHQIAASDHVELKVVNLYIGGCSLERHWHNIVNDAEEYLYEENGVSKGEYVSILQALKMEKWDYIVTQQASYDSGIEKTYYPFLEQIVSYVKKVVPEAEFLLQETWAYEIDSLHDCFVRYENNQQTMYEKLSYAYKKAAKDLNLRLIPCGDIVQKLRKTAPFIYEHGGMSLCRDGFHMNIIYGRYLLAAIWYKFLLGRQILTNSYIPHTELAPHAVCDLEVLEVIKRLVDSEL